MRPTKTRKFVRVSARRAREIIEAEEGTIYICASKMDPDEHGFTKKMTANALEFDAAVDAYKTEMCSRKTGMYPSFFVQKKRAM